MQVMFGTGSLAICWQTISGWKPGDHLRTDIFNWGPSEIELGDVLLETIGSVDDSAFLSIFEGSCISTGLSSHSHAISIPKFTSSFYKQIKEKMRFSCIPNTFKIDKDFLAFWEKNHGA